MKISRKTNNRSFFCLLFFPKKSKGVALPICPKAPDIKPVTERTASIPTWGRMSPITVMAVATDFHRDFLFDARRVLSSTRDRPFYDILFQSARFSCNYILSLRTFRVNKTYKKVHLQKQTHQKSQIPIVAKQIE